VHLEILNKISLKKKLIRKMKKLMPLRTLKRTKPSNNSEINKIIHKVFKNRLDYSVIIILHHYSKPNKMVTFLGQLKSQ
jgi:hypothetical protein